jgi:crotonobetainyl-CoA:carnitine CoA-transferase CaiB-like acyl-CoA transferase
VTPPPEATTPLAGVRVIDFTRILSGPYCSLLLADMGAEVIKVERSDRGDDTRAWGPPFLDDAGKLSTYFAALNRGKKSVALDFRGPSTRELLLRLCEQADVVIENFRPGVRESLGLTWPTLHELNPALVLCSISGFGRSGPYSQLPATEIVVEGMSGLMEITGPFDGDPVRFGIAMVDIATGLTAATKIAASLMIARETGEGAYLDCSLYATALAALGTSVAAYSATAQEPRRWGSHHPSIVPYGGFPTADGHLITGVVNDAMWPSFCEALELPELADSDLYTTNAARVEQREVLQARLADRCRERPTAYWVARLRERSLLAAPIRTVGQAVDDPATHEMGVLVALEGFPGVYSTRLDGNFASERTQRVPKLGEHTQQVLTEILGLTADDVERLTRHADPAISGPAGSR